MRFLGDLSSEQAKTHRSDVALSLLCHRCVRWTMRKLESDTPWRTSAMGNTGLMLILYSIVDDCKLSGP